MIPIGICFCFKFDTTKLEVKRLGMITHHDCIPPIDSIFLIQIKNETKRKTILDLLMRFYLKNYPMNFDVYR